MDLILGRRLCSISLLAILLALTSPLLSEQWTTPTPEELSMTSQPEVPGAAAVYLYREESTEDDLHLFSIYIRLKLLTEGGKKYSNVELNYEHSSDGSYTTIEDVQGRTIHADGTIIPFTGKPYDKLVEKTQAVRVMTKVFTLPDVEIGSIIEYRYKIRLDDRHFMAPTWYIQSELFTRKAHYSWKPTGKELITNDDRGQLTNMVSWTPILPAGTELKQIHLPERAFSHAELAFELNIQNVPPAPDEEFMPPMSSLTYRVLFYYTPYRTGEEYWRSEVKHWSKVEDKFIGPGPGVTAAVHDLVTPDDTPDQKLRKLYAAVMKLENTSFTRQHSISEEKAAGFREVHTTDDIWAQKRGNNDQLTALYVSMARAAGVKAYLARVTSRDKNVFLKQYLSLNQLDDDLAIVTLDGKEIAIDPGSRYCPYGHLAWKHTMAGGIRQSDRGGDLFNTPTASPTESRTQRVGNLKLDNDGTVTGTVKITYIGAPALRWRQSALEGDTTSFERELRTSAEHQLPQDLDVKITSIEKVENYDEPLVVNLDVKGHIGSSTGKRLFIPSDLFQINAKPAFPNEKRETVVYFNYPHYNQDAIRITFPSTMRIESLPATDKAEIPKLAVYAMKTESTSTSFTIRRDYLLGEVIFMKDEYPQLRTLYSKMETKDQESVVLTNAPAPAKPAGN